MGSSRPHLFDGYRIVRQQPKPGAWIVPGIRLHGGFRPTPLTLTVRRISG